MGIPPLLPAVQTSPSLFREAAWLWFRPQGKTCTGLLCGAGVHAHARSSARQPAGSFSLPRAVLPAALFPTACVEGRRQMGPGRKVRLERKLI